jgi:hypothetical protein
MIVPRFSDNTKPKLYNVFAANNRLHSFLSLILHPRFLFSLPMPPSRSSATSSRNTILYTYRRNSLRRPHAPSTPLSSDLPLFPTLTTTVQSIESTVSDNPPTVSALVRSATTKGVQSDVVLGQCLEQLRNVRNFASVYLLLVLTRLGLQMVQDIIQENARIREGLKHSSDKLMQVCFSSNENVHCLMPFCHLLWY